MTPEQALTLEPGTDVLVPFGTRRDALSRGTVVSVKDNGVWGRAMRPAGATPEDRLVLVMVDLGGRRGKRLFGNSVVELAPSRVG